MATAEKRPKPPFPPQEQPAPGLESEMQPRPQFAAAEYRPAGKLEGKSPLITGGDSGIGRAVAVLYAREGANVAIVYLPSEQSDAEETARHIRAADRKALLLPGDVRDKAFCRDSVEKTVREFGHLDILVNNAAHQATCDSLEELDDEQWDRTFRTNIDGYFHLAKAALAHLKEGAVIINTSSITGLEGSKHLIDYASTKGAINAFTKSLAQNLVERGIRVNCVAPGPIWTVLQPASKSGKQVSRHGDDTPMSRPGQPDEVAPAYVFLASNADSSYITGEVLTVLGGKTIAG